MSGSHDDMMKLVALFAEFERPKFDLAGHHRLSTALETARDLLLDNSRADIHPSIRKLIKDRLERIRNWNALIPNQKPYNHQRVKLGISNVELFDDPIFELGASAFDDNGCAELSVLFAHRPFELWPDAAQRRFSELMAKRVARAYAILGAARIFDIDLANSPGQADQGRFKSGPLVDRMVTVQWCEGQRSIVCRVSDPQPEFYLVLSGPRATVAALYGEVPATCIESVHLLSAAVVAPTLCQNGVEVGAGTSVPEQLWSAAEVYPSPTSTTYVLTGEQRAMLEAVSITQRSP